METMLTLLLTIITYSLCDEITDYETSIRNQINSSINYTYRTSASEFAASQPQQPTEYAHYDFIIVGGGSTGSVIANRLSEISKWKILLLEAGNFANNLTDIPGMMSAMLLSDYNWGFKSVPQKTACLDMPNKQCGYPRGQGFGGTSLLNGLMYVRGCKQDFDRWASHGNPGWNYEQVLPYFKKSEDFRKTDNVPVDWEYHHKGGELSVELTRPRHPLINYFLKANKEIGYKVLDYNGRRQSGAAVIQGNTDRGRRGDFGSEFLKPIKNKRRNLKILSRAYVTKIIIEGKKAVGVEFTWKGKTYIARNTKEVILSAGAFGSPQILMLSGIGPKEHLQKVGIKPIVNLRVGDNLKDHPTFYGLNYDSNFSKTHQPLRQYIREYLNGVGPLTSPHFNGGVSFYQTTTDVPDFPDVELIMFPVDYFSDTIAQQLSSAREKTWLHLNKSGTFMLFVVALHAESSGTVRLKSDNPFDYPVIDPKLLSDSGNRDIDSLYKGIQIALNLTHTRTYAQINAKPIRQNVPACENEEYNSKSYWYCVIRQFSWNIYHPVGTCRMGPSPTKGDVVNAKNKVYGIDSLRVADASVFPFTLSGHPNAVCGMIGEKVSDMLKFEHGAVS